MNRFKLEKSITQPHSWVLTDTLNLIVIKFEEHKFNETQKVTFLEESELLKDGAKAADKIAHIMREMGDYMHDNYYCVAMPYYARLAIGQKIKELRTQKGLTLRDLSEQTGFTFANLSNIENGKYSVGLDILAKIADTLGCEIELIAKATE